MDGYTTKSCKRPPQVKHLERWRVDVICKGCDGRWSGFGHTKAEALSDAEYMWEVHDCPGDDDDLEGLTMEELKAQIDMYNRKIAKLHGGSQ